MSDTTARHLTGDDLVLHYYGELPPGDETAAAAHLRGCDGCRAEFARVQRTLGLLDAGTGAVEPPDGFERAAWARLEPALHRTRGAPLAGWLAPVPLALAAAVLLLVAGAFVAGRAVGPPRPETADGTAAVRLQEQILLAEVTAHLERSQMVLVDVVSGASGPEADLSFERTRAEQLVADNRLYRLAAVQTGDAALGELLDEIERVLTELASGPETTPSDDLTALRRRVEARDLLFRLRVVSSALREREREALRGRAHPLS